MPLYLLLSLSGCEPAQVVKTETVEVKVPVYVPLPERLTRSAPIPVLTVQNPTNEDGQAVCERRRDGMSLLNEQLAKIRALQPSQ